MKATQARLSLHLSKCHIVGNHMSWLISIYQPEEVDELHLLAICILRLHKGDVGGRAKESCFLAIKHNFKVILVSFDFWTTSKRKYILMINISLI